MVKHTLKRNCVCIYEKCLQLSPVQLRKMLKNTNTIHVQCMKKLKISRLLLEHSGFGSFLSSVNITKKIKNNLVQNQHIKDKTSKYQLQSKHLPDERPT